LIEKLELSCTDPKCKIKKYLYLLKKGIDSNIMLYYDCENIFKDAISKANQWADANLTPVIIDGKPSKRTTVITADGHDIFVGKKFFTETAAKGKRDPELAHLLKTATEFGEWLPNATLDRIEAGVDHTFNFSVYTVNYQGQKIECKCKMTTGEILYTMRIIK
jgi:hypothetical protein